MCFEWQVTATLPYILRGYRGEISQTEILKVVDGFYFNPFLPSFCYLQNHSNCEALKHRGCKKFMRKSVILSIESSDGISK